MCSHHGCSCGGSLRSHSCLVGLVLGGLNLGLQVGRGMEVLALLAGAAALDVVHAHSDSVVAGVDHGAVAWVGKAAVRLPASTVAPLELTAHLGAGQSNAQANIHTHTNIDRYTDTQMYVKRENKRIQTHTNCEYLCCQ